MRILRLKAVNFCRHAELDMKFSTGLIGLVGPNGSGKSTTINAVYACLTNDFSRHPYGREGCIRKGTAPGEKSYVELLCEAEDRQFTLRRNLVGKPLSSLSYVDEDGETVTMTKATEIAIWLRETVDLTPQVASRYMFIPQGSLTEFLILPESQRMEAFAHLCGTNDLQKIYDVLVKSYSSDEERLKGLYDDDSLTELEAAVESAQLLCETKKEELTQLEQQLGEFRSEAELGVPVDEYGKFTIRAQRHQDMSQRVVKLDEALKGLACRGEAARLNCEALEKSLKEDKDKVTKAREELKRNSINEAAIKKRASIQAKVNEAAERMEALKVLIETKGSELTPESVVDEYREILNRLTFERENFVSVGLKDSDSICLFCGSSKEHWSSSTMTDEQVASRLAEVTKEQQHYSKLISEHGSAKKQFADLESQLNRVKSSCEAYQSELETYKDIPEKLLDVWEVQSYTGLIGKFEEMEGRYISTKATYDEIVRQYATMETDLQTCRRQIAELNYVVSDAESLKQSAEEAETELSRRRELSMQVSAKKAELDETIRSYSVQCDLLSNQQKRRSTLSRIRDWLGILGKLKEAFHRTGIASTINNSVFFQLNEYINKELRDFEARFYVESNMDLTFTAVFNDGVRSSSTELSGGEKVMLALAFRTSIYRLYADHLGVMSFDEPLDGLDEANRLRAITIFDKWRNILKSRRQQAFIVTHDVQMSSVFDNTFDFGEV